MRELPHPGLYFPFLILNTCHIHNENKTKQNYGFPISLVTYQEVLGEAIKSHGRREYATKAVLPSSLRLSGQTVTTQLMPRGNAIMVPQLFGTCREVTGSM